jgi:sulfide:quinone oxidoreductase
MTGVDVTAVAPSGALVGAGGVQLAIAERVIALPQLRGPEIEGLPSDAAGFLPVDDRGRVIGAPGVYAAGDATAGPLKHGGLAAQQAEHIAHEIAQRAGAPVSAGLPQLVLRAQVLEGAISRFVRAPVGSGGRGTNAVLSDEPLWWPPLKVAAPRLARHLAETRS